ncbi:hypothetical protein G3I24_06800 [Micromonospora aurantiaca]|nr:hypothetical protein [Micromonospora aurantiaca]
MGEFLQRGAFIIDGEDVEHEGDFAAITVRPQSIPGSEYGGDRSRVTPETLPDGTLARAN